MGCTSCRRSAACTRPPSGGIASEAVSLLLEGIGVVVVAVALPEAGAVVGGELDPTEPLRALPEVLPGDHEAERAAVLGRERLAVGVGREERQRGAEER